MANYKGIDFAKDYNRSFADFKKSFASTHVFDKIPKDKKEAELKKAYKIATNGNIVTTSAKSEKPKRGSNNKGTIIDTKEIAITDSKA